MKARPVGATRGNGGVPARHDRRADPAPTGTPKPELGDEGKSLPKTSGLFGFCASWASGSKNAQAHCPGSVAAEPANQNPTPGNPGPEPLGSARLCPTRHGSTKVIVPMP